MGGLRGDEVTNYAMKGRNKMETDMFSGDCEESENDDRETERIAEIILKQTITMYITYSICKINIHMITSKANFTN